MTNTAIHKIQQPDTCFDLPLELMKLSVKKGSSSFYPLCWQKLCEALEWSPKKWTRYSNGTDSMSEMEIKVARVTLLEIEESLDGA